MSTRRQRSLQAGILVLALAMAACSDPPRTGPTASPGSALGDAAHIRQALGVAQAVVAQASVSIHREHHDPEHFDLTWWCAQDGRIKVVASQHDVDFVTALVDRAGTYEAVLPRDRVRTAGTLAPAANTPWLLTAVRLAGSDLLQGPLGGCDLTAGPGPDMVLIPLHDGVKAQVTLAPATSEVASKRLFAADDSELVMVAYQRYQTYDEVRRPSVLTLTFGDGTVATLYLRQLRSVGRISDEGMHLHPPAAATVVELPDFLSRLEHLGNG